MKTSNGPYAAYKAALGGWIRIFTKLLSRKAQIIK